MPRSPESKLLNPWLNAVIIPLFEKARTQANNESIPDGPFKGVPFLLKDLVCAFEAIPFAWECTCFAMDASLLHRTRISPLNSRLPDSSVWEEPTRRSLV